MDGRTRPEDCRGYAGFSPGNDVHLNGIKEPLSEPSTTTRDLFGAVGSTHRRPDLIVCYHELV